MTLPISDKQIRAGDAVLKRHDFAFWEKMDEAEGHSLIRDIYLAMLKEAPVAQELVERRLRDLVAELEAWPDYMIEALRETDEAKRLAAALTTSPDTRQGLKIVPAKPVRLEDDEGIYTTSPDTREALMLCERELSYCAKQLAAHGQTGAPGDSVDRALNAARTILGQVSGEGDRG